MENTKDNTVQPMMSAQIPLVSILCDAFNHENFIEDALRGFLKQTTNFPFEIVVHEDASSDRTAAILKKYQEQYPEQIRVIFQTQNQFSKKGLNLWRDITFKEARGKYIALCEGDDYWIDPLKLQKQVDFLESHPDYVISWTNYLNSKEGQLVPNDFKNELPEIYTIDFDNLFNPYCTLTLTCVFKKSAIDFDKYAEFQHAKDNTLYGLVLCSGKGVYLNFESAVYRWHSGGIYSLQSNFFKRYSSYLNIKEIYDLLPAAQTSNIKKTVKALFKATAYEAIVLYATKKNQDAQVSKIVKDYFAEASMSKKISFIWQYVKSKWSTQ